MTIIVRHADEQWTVEIDGQLLGRTKTEKQAQALIESWRNRARWVSSWRFC